MSDFSQSPTRRLDRVLFEVIHLAQGQLPAGLHPIAAMRENADRAATLLMELYGDEALERALQIEKRSAQSVFARAVRLSIEELRGDAANS